METKEMELVAPRPNAELHALHPTNEISGCFTLCNRQVRHYWIDGIRAGRPTCKQCLRVLAKIKG